MSEALERLLNLTGNSILPMPLGDLAELLGAVHCPNCGAGPDAIRVAQDTNEIEVVE